jgi:histone H3/H4
MIKEQRKLTPAIQKATFARVVKQIVGEKSRNGDLRIQKDAIVNLQRVAEDFIIERMRDSDMVAQVCGKWTLQPEHMDVARRIKALPGEKNAPTIDLGTSAEDATQASE